MGKTIDYDLIDRNFSLQSPFSIKRMLDVEHRNRILGELWLAATVRNVSYVSHPGSYRLVLGEAAVVGSW